MPTANYDSSLLSKQRRAAALVTFYNATNTAVQNGGTVRREQPDCQLGEVLTQRMETKVNNNPSTEVCSCTTINKTTPGGANSNNVQ
jgi:hypothetical protein